MKFLFLWGKKCYPNGIPLHISWDYYIFLSRLSLLVREAVSWEFVGTVLFCILYAGLVLFVFILKSFCLAALLCEYFTNFPSSSLSSSAIILIIVILFFLLVSKKKKYYIHIHYENPGFPAHRRVFDYHP